MNLDIAEKAIINTPWQTINGTVESNLNGLLYLSEHFL